MFIGNSDLGEIQIIKTAKVFENKELTIHNDVVEMPDKTGSHKLRIEEKCTHKVATCCIENGKILLLKKFNHTERKWLWTIPHTIGSKNSNPHNDALKCIHDQTSYSTTSLSNKSSFKDNGKTVYIFIADCLNNGTKPFKINDCIKESKLFDRDSCNALIANGDVDHITTTSILSAMGRLSKASLSSDIDKTINFIELDPVLTSQSLLDPDARNNAFQRGINAKILGKSQHYNPYRNLIDHHDLADAWLEGWSKE